MTKAVQREVFCFFQRNGGTFQGFGVKKPRRKTKSSILYFSKSHQFWLASLFEKRQKLLPRFSRWRSHWAPVEGGERAGTRD